MNPRFSPLLLGALAAASLCATSVAADPAPTECRWAATPPVIDGKIDEAVWKNAQVIESFTKGWETEAARKPATHTKARLLWDREYLYFSCDMQDTDVYASVKEQDGTTWFDDVFELFFKPAKEKTGYYEFEINAANAKLDMFMPSRGSGGLARHGKDRDFHIESAVQVHGTLNNYADQDTGWTVEGRIPWRDFLPTGGRPAPGEVWQHALCRYDYSAGLNNPDLSCTAPLSKPNFHLWEDYIPLKFVGAETGVAQRAPWETSRLIGSPDGPLPYTTVPAFPELKLKGPITIVNEPGRDGFLLIETSGYSPVRTSRLSRLANNPAAKEMQTLLDFDELVFDVCFHPKFAENGYLYLGVNARTGEGKEDFSDRILRYTMNRQTGRIDPASRLVLMEWPSYGHNGDALLFGNDGMLYITSGDGGSNSDEWSSGQDLTRPLAKLLRIDVDHPANGKPYGIPSDNPFLKTPGARPETWAYGFRNPWRMTIDRPTGDIWVAENGQDLWEYARIVHKGENYGWPVYEGSHDFHQNRMPLLVPPSKPLVEHSHTDFRSMTGGIVYRGTKFPDLYGHYIYGDHSTGQIWAALQKDGKLVEDKQIARNFGITNFCETPQGDILVIDHLGSIISKLAVPPPAAPAPPFPTKLSETGLFTNTASLTPQPGVIPYEVISPGWHDGATMERYVALPGLARADYKDQNGWDFPDGAALVQTLSLEGKRIETRVMLRQYNEWNGYSFAWNPEQTEATRVPAGGENRTLAAGREWRFPGKQECVFCHSRQANFIMGFATPQLNRPGKSGENQLALFERMGLFKYNHAVLEESEWRKEFDDRKLTEDEKARLTSMISLNPMQRQPPKDGTLLPHAPDQLPKLVDPRDEKAPLADRARAYLHTNCAHCHMHNAGGNSGFLLASSVPEKDMLLRNALPRHATFGIADARVVAPGDPARSILVYRPAIRGPGQMPPVGTSVADPDGVALLVKWIASMPAEPTPTTATGK
jgi:glucose/arabinose dehydrogenase/mono/diheme cytochrome c family protein